jgi:hypothetical protein
MTHTIQHTDPAVVVTRMLAASDPGMPFATFELTLQQAQPDLAALDGIHFGTYAGEVVYSNELRRGLDDALARDWVQVDGQLLRATPRGRAALDECNATPDDSERAVLSKFAA